MQVKHYLSISLLLAALAACQTNPEVVVPQMAPQAGARAAAPGLTDTQIAQVRRMIVSIIKQRTTSFASLRTFRSWINDDRLNTAAQKHAEYMATKDYIGSTGSKGSTPSSRVTAEGYTFKAGTPPKETYYKRLSNTTDRAVDDAVATINELYKTNSIALGPRDYTDLGVGVSYSTTYKAYYYSIITAAPK